MSRTWAGGSTRAWRRLRTLVLARDGHQCRAHNDGWCDRSTAHPHQCTGHATHVHHTHGRTTTGDDPAYLVAACAPCNLAIGNPTKTADPLPAPRTRW